jgi:hypothetical protein
LSSFRCIPLKVCPAKPTILSSAGRLLNQLRVVDGKSTKLLMNITTSRIGYPFELTVITGIDHCLWHHGGCSSVVAVATTGFALSTRAVPVLLRETSSRHSNC